MTRRIVWSSIGAVLIAVGVTAAWAEAQGWRGWYRPVWFHAGPWAYVAHELDLSGAQREQVKAIWDGERPNIAVLIHELAGEQKEMDAISLEGAPDDGKIQDIAARQGATLARLLVEKQQLAAKIYSSVLTPAQRAKADEFRKRCGSRLDRFADRIVDAPEGK